LYTYPEPYRLQAPMPQETLSGRLLPGNSASPRYSALGEVVPIGSGPRGFAPPASMPNLAVLTEAGGGYGYGFGDTYIDNSWGSLQQLLEWSQSDPYYGAPSYFAQFVYPPSQGGDYNPDWLTAPMDPLAPTTPGTMAYLRAGAGLDRTMLRMFVDLATDPGLEFDAAGNAGKLRVRVDGTRGLSLDANGVGLDPIGGAKYDVFYVNAAGGITRGPQKLRA